MNRPKKLLRIEAKTRAIGFNRASNHQTGALLRTLATSKKQANILELGTGTGLALAWLVDGMDAGSRITSIDNDPDLCRIARSFFAEDDRVKILCQDGGKWLKSYCGKKVDILFADAWPGKYSDIEIALALVKPRGFYVIDDMISQPNWPEGHQEKVDNLLKYLDGRNDFHLVNLDCSTGIILMTKTSNYDGDYA